MSPMHTTIAVGVVLAGLMLPLLCVPGKARAWLAKFPRSRSAAWIVTSADMVWVGFLVADISLCQRYPILKPVLVALVPIAVVTLVCLLDEMLAARALGGLLLLVASPVLRGVQWCESSFRLVVAVMAYLWIVAGVVLVCSPYRFRQVVSSCCANDRRCRLVGVAGLALGLCVILIGALKL